MGLGVGLALGMGALDLIEGKRREKQENALRRSTRPIRQELRQAFAEQSKQLKELPGLLKRSREGRLSTAQSERMKRLDRALASSGATGATTAGQIGERNIMRDMEQMIAEGELRDAMTVQGARSNLIGTGSALQNAIMSVPRSSYSPLSAIKAGIGGYALGNALSGPTNPAVQTGAESVANTAYRGSLNAGMNNAMGVGTGAVRDAMSGMYGVPEDAYAMNRSKYDNLYNY